MPIREKMLRVFANPWLYIDHLGRPAGVVRLDPFEHNSNRAWVGARIANVTETRKAYTEIIRGKAFQGTPSSHDIEWEFDEEAVEVPNTAYYRDQICAGSLIAADKKSAAQAGITPDQFRDPTELLAELKQAAIKDFDAHTGEGAFEYFAKARAEAAEQASVAEAEARAAAEAEVRAKGADVASKVARRADAVRRTVDILTVATASEPSAKDQPPEPKGN